LLIVFATRKNVFLAKKERKIRPLIQKSKSTVLKASNTRRTSASAGFVSSSSSLLFLMGKSRLAGPPFSHKPRTKMKDTPTRCNTELSSHGICFESNFSRHP
jgi:hypothetical protein